jgi:hypothetical protein
LAAFRKALARENVAAREDVAPVTVRGYRSDLGLFAAWYGGHPSKSTRPAISPTSANT